MQQLARVVCTDVAMQICDGSVCLKTMRWMPVVHCAVDSLLEGREIDIVACLHVEKMTSSKLDTDQFWIDVL